MAKYTQIKDLASLYPEKDYNLVIYSGKINEHWKFCGIVTSISALRNIKKDIRHYIIYEPILDFLIILNGMQITYYHVTPEWFHAELLLRTPTPEEFVETIDSDGILDYENPVLIELLKK